MKSFPALSYLVFSLILLGACATPPEVVQGTVVSYEESVERLVVADERVPGSSLEFSISGAEVGADLMPGDIVRLAYYREGQALRATRIMNITRQSELSQPAGGH